MGLKRLLAAMVVSLPVCCLLASPAGATLAPFYNAVGSIRLSSDAIGSNSGSATVQAEKPAGSTVRKAFLFGASTGASLHVPTDDEIHLDGNAVAWDASHTVASSISSYNVAADVTDFVKAKLDAAAPGRVDFTVTEALPTQMDGEILVVLFDVPAVPSTTITLLYGTQQTSGDTFDVGLGKPLRPSSDVTMALGISFGHQPAGQYSEVNVNKSRVTTSAGGEDDGYSSNGELITMGGLDDSTDLPANPFGLDDCGLAPRCDDELYSLKSFVAAGETQLTIDTRNPSNDDNILVAALQLDTPAVVGEGVLLTPTTSRVQSGTFVFFHTLAQGDDGKPLKNRSVTLKVTDGPSTGLTLHAVTDNSGKANFNYTSTSLGSDTLKASFTDDDGIVHESNAATLQWVPFVGATLGGEWPYDGNRLDLSYTYGNDHRYLGNAFQGFTNWNDAGTKVHINAWPGPPTAIQVPFFDYYEVSDTYGYTTWPDSGEEGCQQCGFIRTPIGLNQYMLDKQSDAQRTKVATHELGHAIGLDHPRGDQYVDDPTFASVMWQGPLRKNVLSTPQPFDTDRVKAMYK
jgi:hypothetical protein